MRSSKSRSRSKPNRSRPSGGNVVNRVFDSSGPEGKVRGTPQQIIDKYQMLARDAQLSNDRVAAENFLQHAEHYTRMLGEAQREMEDRRLQQERENQARQSRENQEREAREARRAEQERPQPNGAAQERGEREPRRADAEEAPREGARRERRSDAREASATAEDARGAEPQAAEDAGPIETPEERKRTRRSRTRRSAEAKDDGAAHSSEATG